MIARASARSGATGRPTNVARIVIVVSADARSTEGSKRVAAAKHATIAIAVAVRGTNESRPSSGAKTTSTNATFAPETARRCDRPDAR